MLHSRLDYQTAAKRPRWTATSGRRRAASVDRTRPEVAFHRGRFARAFTLVEVLAALLFMAIVIPVAMHGVSVASRAGILGQRKATAMRVAESLLEEMIVTDQVSSGAGNGSVVEGDTTYPWTMKAEDWTEAEMTQVTVRVSFDVQGNTFEVSASTLFDPNAATTTTTATNTTTR
jgi:type II secretory pathway pseudopilin PulG